MIHSAPSHPNAQPDESEQSSEKPDEPELPPEDDPELVADDPDGPPLLSLDVLDIDELGILDPEDAEDDDEPDELGELLLALDADEPLDADGTLLDDLDDTLGGGTTIDGISGPVCGAPACGSGTWGTVCHSRWMSLAFWARCCSKARYHAGVPAGGKWSGMIYSVQQNV